MRTRPVLILILALAFGATAGVIPEVEQHQLRSTPLHDQLADPETADSAIAAVLGQDDALQQLDQVAREGTDLSARGRAILAIQGVEGPKADAVLKQLAHGRHPALVKNWAAAAQVNRSSSLDEFIEISKRYTRQFPAVARPIELKAAQLLVDAELADMLKLLHAQPNLARAIAPQVMKAPSGDLIRLMQTHGDDGVRRQAAAYLAAKGQQSGKSYSEVADATVASLAYSKRTRSLPWEGGALYVPSVQWKKAEALALIRVLIQWNLHCDRLELTNQQRQVQNNLRSVQLLQAAGFQNAWPDVNSPDVLVEYGKVAGSKDVRALLAEQGMMDSRWAEALR